MFYHSSKVYFGVKNLWEIVHDFEVSVTLSGKTFVCSD